MIIQDEIEFFQYDLYDASGNIIIKFHSEPHERKAYQTETEPFHMHVKEDEKDLSASKRMSLDKRLREMDDILSFIKNSRHIQYLYLK